MDMVALKSKTTVLYVFLMLGGLFILNGCIEDFSNEIPQKTAAKNKWYDAAGAYMKQGVYDSALTAVSTAIGQAIDKNDSLLLGNAYFLKGYIYWRQDNDAAALTNYYYALEVYEHNADFYRMARLLSNIGKVYQNNNDLEKALENYKKALDAANNNPELLFVIVNNIGLTYKNMEVYDQAIEYYHQGLTLAKHEQSIEYQSIFMSNLCLAYWHKEDFENAEKYGLEALEIEKQSGNERRLALLINNLALVYWETRQMDQALSYFQQSVAIKEKYNDRTLNNGYNNLAELYLEKKDYQKANEYLDKALVLNSSRLNDRSKTYELKSTLAEAQGNLRLLANYQKQVIILKDSIHTKQIALNTIGRKNLALITQVEGKIRMSRIEHENEMHKVEIAHQRMVTRWIITSALLLVVGLALVSIKQWQVNQLRLRVDTYTKNMAHTARNQLHAVKGHFKYIKMHLERVDPPLKPLVRTEVFRSVDEGDETIDSVKGVVTKIVEADKVSKIKANMDLYDASSIIATNVKSYTPHAREKHITLKEEIISEPMVAIDREACEGAVGNLFSNAIKYSPEGSTVTVRLYDEENKVYLQVLDEGPGIAEKDKKKLFKKGVKLHNRKDIDSSGVGLYYTKKDIEEMDGKIGHKNRPEGGSVFTIEFSKMM